MGCRGHRKHVRQLDKVGYLGLDTHDFGPMVGEISPDMMLCMHMCFYTKMFKHR